jgi:hypothetical protein
MQYASREIDCRRHHGDVDGLCYRHGIDWNICIDLMISKADFCKMECSTIHDPTNLADPVIYEDIYHRVNRTGMYISEDEAKVLNLDK